MSGALVLFGAKTIPVITPDEIVMPESLKQKAEAHPWIQKQWDQMKFVFLRRIGNGEKKLMKMDTEGIIKELAELIERRWQQRQDYLKRHKAEQRSRKNSEKDKGEGDKRRPRDEEQDKDLEELRHQRTNAPPPQSSPSSLMKFQHEAASRASEDRNDQNVVCLYNAGRLEDFLASPEMAGEVLRDIAAGMGNFGKVVGCRWIAAEDFVSPTANKLDNGKNNGETTEQKKVLRIDVCFENEKSASQAAAQINGKLFDGNELRSCRLSRANA